jgi:hypothetical protein
MCKGPAYLLALGALAFTAPIHAAAPRATPAPPALSIEPTEIVLCHAHDRHRLLVTATYPDGTVRDLTRSATFQPASRAIATVSADGVVRPVAAGKTALRVRAAGQVATINVTVSAVAVRPVSFANDVMPLLARAGCNSGACHGSASGKKGFKVSLRGYDPAADYVTLTRGTTGRRLDPIAPARSLLVLKPTGQVPHEGGLRFDRNSTSANLLRRWIAEGARSDLATAPKLVGLEVSPSARSFAKPGGEQQLLVKARFSDGSVRDVTEEARYTSNNESAALPDDNGLVRLPERGEAAVMVRYGHLIAVSNLVVLRHDPGFRWPNVTENNYIDRHVFAKLKRIQAQPSELTTDAEFLRRVYYDVIGTPPTPAEVRAFLADVRPDKRARVIDALLERPEHAEFWANKWADLFRLRFDLTGDKGTWGMYRWLRDSIASNKPFDQFVSEVLTAEGSTEKNAPANFYRVFNTPDEAAEATAQIFLGIRLLCARCHDHPFEKWVQKDYYGLTAFFAQMTRKPGARPGDVVIYRREAVPQSRHPITGEALRPKYLDGDSITVAAGEDGRKALADWLTRKDNPFLARATVNRIWGQLFARAIIDPVDDIRSSNPPSNPELLDALAKDFVARGFDVRHVLRTILNSRTYQTSARTNATTADDRINFSHALPRRLTAEQLLDTLAQITGVREGFRSRFGSGTVALPVGGVRAGALPDRALTTELLDLFGRPRGESTCACERNDEASLTQALHLINGKVITARINDPNGRVARMAKAPGMTEAALVEDLYLTVLCRLPTATEQALMRKHFAAAPDRVSAAQDVMWALLNARAFLFNH